MKYCPKCGTETESRFCPNCGTAMQEKRPRCPRCGMEADSKFCPNCGTAIRPEAPPRVSVPPSTPPAATPQSLGLGWHKFLIYFALWCSGVVDIVSGVRLFQSGSALMGFGGSYGTMLLVLGAAAVVVGVFIIYVRFQLAGFRRGAPGKLLIAIAGTTVINVIGQYYTYQMTNDSSAVGSIVGGLVFFFICWRYYTNRKDLFVN